MVEVALADFVTSLAILKHFEPVIGVSNYAYLMGGRGSLHKWGTAVESEGW